jgi:hypothetical protein
VSDFDETLGAYLAVLRTADIGGDSVVAGRTLVAMALVDLERALADPGVLADDDGTVPTRPVDRLRVLMRFALWLRLTPPGVLPVEFASRAARYRFLVWTLLVRLGWPADLKVRNVTLDRDYPVGRREVLAEARSARSDWLGHLENREADPWLSARHSADPDLIEADLRWLTGTWPAPTSPAHNRPLSLAFGTDQLSQEADHRPVAQLVVEQHWIGRGALLAATTAYFPGSAWRRIVPSVTGPVVAAIPVLVIVLGFVDTGRWVAASVGAAAVLAAGLVPPTYTVLGLARVPAAVVVGEAVLLSLTPRWWTGAGGWRLGVALLVLALGYLVYESRAHGSRGRRALLRGAGLLLVGATYAFCISVAVLGFVAPALAERGECLDGWWTVGPFEARMPGTECVRKLDLGPGTQLPAAAGVLTLMAGWSLGVGLAAQVLWDDRPVSAPLGRVRRVKGTA